MQDCKAVQLIVRECNDKVTVVPNMNAGGAGGFSRGMIEILKKRDLEDFTHILLMDDDAIVEPDLLVRIYGFLSTIKRNLERYHDWRSFVKRRLSVFVVVRWGVVEKGKNGKYRS